MGISGIGRTTGAGGAGDTEEVGAAQAVADLRDIARVLGEDEFKARVDGGPAGERVLFSTLALLGKCAELRGKAPEGELQEIVAEVENRFLVFANLHAHRGGDLSRLDARLASLPKERLASLQALAFQFMSEVMAELSVAKEPELVATYARIGLKFAASRLMDPQLKAKVDGEDMDLRTWMEHRLVAAETVLRSDMKMGPSGP